MVKGKKIKSDTVKWAEKIGHREAIKRLINSGLSARTAQGLVCGSYDHETSYETNEKIVDALMSERNEFMEAAADDWEKE